MNRRDFLKTAALALSALALPKLLALKPKPALTGATLKDLGVKSTVAAKDLRAMAEAAVEANKGLRVHRLQDCFPISGELEEDGTLCAETLLGYIDGTLCAETLMGVPVVWTGELTVSPEVPLVFDDWERWAYNDA